METIKVNMTPCEDIKTIHASQNDNEAREWGFELHNNGEKIDSSSISDQLVFKAYKGGTEEILPTNGSTPTTSPFKGDIKYPQGLLTDQEFTYRQSPTEEDGLAKITDIKGNTLVWNQLVPIGETSKSMTVAGVTITDNRDGSYTFNGTATATQYLWLFNRQAIPSFIKPNHKYLIRSMASDPVKIRMQFILYGATPFIMEETGGNILTTPSDFSSYTDFGLVIAFINGNTFANEKLYPVLIDLTEMGLGSLDADGFASLFPLSYYSYNQGTLLSFNGNGIKTVSKNQFNTRIVSPSTTVGTTLTKGDGSIRLQYTGTDRYTGFNFMNPNGGLVSDWANKLLLKKKYRLSFDFGGAEVAWTCGLRTASANSFVGSITMQNQGHYSLTLNLDTMGEDVYISWARTGNSTSPFDVTVSNIQLELGTTETPYTPFEEKTISLPISQYFPDGMDGVGTAYDELTESKAYHRMTRVDLGSLTWNRSVINDGYAFVSSIIANMIPTGNVATANVLCAKYTLSMGGNGYYMPNDKTYRVGGTYFGIKRVIIRDDSYTDAATFKQAMADQNVKLYYELETPIETSFTTASLVTENAEIPLSNENGTLIGKCTEQLSSESGFFDAKIKLADADGECYSNKIQLHVERSPQ